MAYVGPQFLVLEAPGLVLEAAGGEDGDDTGHQEEVPWPPHDDCLDQGSALVTKLMTAHPVTDPGYRQKDNYGGRQTQNHHHVYSI